MIFLKCKWKDEIWINENVNKRTRVGKKFVKKRVFIRQERRDEDCERERERERDDQQELFGQTIKETKPVMPEDNRPNERSSGGEVYTSKVADAKTIYMMSKRKKSS